MKKINAFKNVLLERTEHVLHLESESAPSKTEVSKTLAKELGADESLIVVKQISNHFGTHDFKVRAFVYDSLETMKKIEPRVKVKKTGGAS